MEVEEVLVWADDHVEELTHELYWETDVYDGSGEWPAEPEPRSRIRARVISALVFLDQFTGTGSRWSEAARDVVGKVSPEDAARAVGDVIEEWTRVVRSGQVKPKLVESFSARAASSTDLLDQVRALNEDKDIIPAAPIVLAGAALEVALRSAVDELDLPVTGRPSISTYAQALRQADVLNKQHVKDVISMAGLRNDAAHGDHGELSRQGARLMEQQVDIFLDRLDQAVQQSS